MSLNKDALNEAFQCPVCFERFDGRILLCNAGHQICEACKKKITECPQCRSKYTGTRNYMMEEVIALMKKQQLFEKKIKKTKPAKEKEPSVHKSDEINRRRISPAPVQTRGLVRCEMIGCATSLPICRMLNHIRYFHKNLLHEVRLIDSTYLHNLQIPLRNYRFAMQIANFGLFFLIIDVKKCNGFKKLSAWIQGTCKNRETREFFYTLKIKTETFEAEYSDLVYGKNQTVDYVEDNEECLSLQTMSQNCMMNIDIKIIRSVIPIKTPREKNTMLKKLPIPSAARQNVNSGRGKKNKRGGRK